MTEILLGDLFFDTDLWNTPVEVLTGESEEHHGVKGMRWGIRKDRGGGTRSTSVSTSDGTKVTVSSSGGSKASVSVNDKPVASYSQKNTKVQITGDKVTAAPKNNTSTAQRETSNLKSKLFASTASDTELRNAISRIRLEREYKALMLQESPLKAMANRLTNKAIAAAEDVFFESAKMVAKPYVAGMMDSGVTDYAKKRGRTLIKYEKDKDKDKDKKKKDDDSDINNAMASEKKRAAEEKSRSEDLDRQIAEELEKKKRRKNPLDLD